MKQNERKYGGRTTITRRDGESFEHEPLDEREPVEGDEPLASVGISVSIGETTPYGAEKYEVSAWCTLPCPMDEGAIKSAQAHAYTFVKTELGQRRRDVLDTFFPGMRRGDDDG